MHDPDDNEEDLTIPDDALQEIAEVAPTLTDQERQYVYWRTMATPPTVAFRRAGYTGSSWKLIESRPKIRTAMADLAERMEPQWRISQNKVIGILMEAVEIARQKDQAKNMIEGAVALANVSGVMAAQKVQISNQTQITVEHREEVMALRHMPRTQLESLVGIQRALPNPHIIDAEYVEVGSE